MSGFGRIKDHFDTFLFMRTSYRKDQDKEIEKVKSKFNMLSFSVNQARSKSMTPVWGSKTFQLDPILRSEDDTSPQCRLCSKAFGLTRKAMHCPTCGLRVCYSCVSKDVTVDAVDPNGNPVIEKVEVCLQCDGVLRYNKSREALKQKIQKARKSVLVTNHDIAIESRGSIVELMPNLAYILTIPHDTIILTEWNLAHSLVKNLAELFREIEVSLKEILTTPATTPRQKILLRNIQSAFNQWLATRSAEYKVMQKELSAIPKPPADRKASVTSPRGGPSAGPPVLSTIDPVVFPLAGGMTTVTGSRFSPGIKVLVGDKIPCEVKRVSEGKLLVRLPSADAPGLQSITLINSAEHQLRMEGIIYTDEVFSHSNENLIREDDYQPTIAFTTSTLLKEMKMQEQALLQEDLRRQEEKAKNDRDRRRAEAEKKVENDDEKKKTDDAKREEELKKLARRTWGKAVS